MEKRCEKYVQQLGCKMLEISTKQFDEPTSLVGEPICKATHAARTVTMGHRGSPWNWAFSHHVLQVIPMGSHGLHPLVHLDLVTALACTGSEA